MSLSKYLGVKAIDLKQKGVYDVVNFPLDDRYFVDIFKAKGTNIPEFEHSYSNFLAYFSNISSLLSNSSRVGDSHWNAAKGKLLFKEVQGLSFGFSVSLGKGSGLGHKFARQMTLAAKEIVKKGILDPEAFLFAPFLEDDIGFDRISDMVVSILFNDFAKYTERVCEELGIDKNIREIKGRRVDGEDDKPVFRLPCYINIKKKVAFPILFCPSSFARRMPGNFDWEDPFDFYLQDDEYKKKVNNLICTYLGREKFAKKEIKKRDFKEVLLSNSSVFSKVVDTVSKTDSIDVDLRKNANDYVLTKLLTKNEKSASIEDQVRFICNEFKFIVEDQGHWRTFYRDGYHLHEEHIQAYFYFLAYSFCNSFDTDLFPEHHTGTGRVDFYVGSTGVPPVLVEVKLTTHSKFYDGFVRQLPKYLKSTRASKGFYLAVKILNAPDYFSAKTPKEKEKILTPHKKKIDNKIKTLAKKKHEGSIPCEQIIVDGLPQKSASK